MICLLNRSSEHFLNKSNYLYKNNILQMNQANKMNETHNKIIKNKSFNSKKILKEKDCFVDVRELYLIDKFLNKLFMKLVEKGKRVMDPHKILSASILIIEISKELKKFFAPILVGYPKEKQLLNLREFILLCKKKFQNLNYKELHTLINT